jgi:hypothetical protein
MARSPIDAAQIDAASEMLGGTVKVKKAAMNVTASWNDAKAERFDALDRQIDQALGRLYGEIAAEPLSASLTALSRRLMLKDSNE